jgi:hypothetical protein
LQRASTICESLDDGPPRLEIPRRLVRLDDPGERPVAVELRSHARLVRVGASRSTSAHASSSSAVPGAVRPEEVGKICRLRPPEPRTHWTRAMNGGSATGLTVDVPDPVGRAVVVELAVVVVTVTGADVAAG